MITKENIDLIHKYLEDDLNPSEITAFKDCFNNNPEFANEVKKYTDLKIALKSTSKLRISKNITHPIIWMSPAKLAIAASFALILGIGGYYLFAFKQQSEYKQLYAAYYKNPNINKSETLTRSADVDIDPQLSKDFSLAISYMEKKDFKEAQKILLYLEGLSENNLSDEIEWYLALCYLRLGQKEVAIDYFTQIFNSDSKYSHEARNIYNELNSD